MGRPERSVSIECVVRMLAGNANATSAPGAPDRYRPRVSNGLGITSVRPTVVIGPVWPVARRSTPCRLRGEVVASPTSGAVFGFYVRETIGDNIPQRFRNQCTGCESASAQRRSVSGADPTRGDGGEGPVEEPRLGRRAEELREVVRRERLAQPRDEGRVQHREVMRDVVRRVGTTLLAARGHLGRVPPGIPRQIREPNRRPVGGAVVAHALAWAPARPPRP